VVIFYTLVNGERAEVKVIGGKYLRTVKDGIENNNLDKLPNC
jgi:hypothetical protein